MFREPLQSVLVIDIVYPEPLAVTRIPLEVVKQRPHEVSLHFSFVPVTKKKTDRKSKDDDHPERILYSGNRKLTRQLLCEGAIDDSGSNRFLWGRLAVAREVRWNCWIQQLLRLTEKG